MNSCYDEILAKKQAILYELECAKNKMLKDLSLIDKCTLKKLRDIVCHYEKIEKNITAKINSIEAKINTFIHHQTPIFKEEYNPDTLHLNISVMLQGDKPVNDNGIDFTFKSETESTDIFHEMGCCHCHR